MSVDGTIVGNEVRFERLLPGPIERVFAHLTEAEHLRAWFGPQATAIPPRVGARFDFGEPGKQGTIFGTVTRCEPPRLLAYTWEAVMPPDDPHRDAPVSEVTWQLTPRGDEVALLLTHRAVWADYLGRTMGGWHTLIERLRAVLAGREPEPFMDVFNRVIADYERAARGPGSAS